MLFVDDIQFFSGREAMLEQFLHTFDSRYQRGGRIELKSVIDGFTVRKTMQRAVDEARRINRVGMREFMGDGPDGMDYDGDGYPDTPVYAG